MGFSLKKKIYINTNSNLASIEIYPYRDMEKTTRVHDNCGISQFTYFELVLCYFYVKNIFMLVFWPSPPPHPLSTQIQNFGSACGHKVF